LKKRLKQQLKDYLRTFIRPDNLITYPDLIERPPGSRIVVLSPHFDDDVIGCGGTLYRHVKGGDSVTVVYLTDGREGDPSFTDTGLLSMTRKEEARRATKILGIHDLIFIDEPETKLSATGSLITKLDGLLNEIKPDLIYIPSFLDNHIDHFEVNRILLRLRKQLSYICNVAAYEVWTPLLPNVLVDITSVAQIKEEALRQYTTQLRQVDYAGTTLALNRFRSAVHLRGKGYAEAFLVVSLKEYAGLMEGLKLSERVFISRGVVRTDR
jgi:LmbE family N-acetylglucosaminyl deacetylase